MSADRSRDVKCARAGNEECVQKIVRCGSARRLPQQTRWKCGFRRVGCVRWDNEVVLDVQRNDAFSRRGCFGPAPVERKINDDAYRRGERGASDANAFNRLLPVYWHRNARS